MLGCPGAARPGVTLTAPEQELGQAVARAHQIASGVLDAAHQVAETFVGDARHERERQLAGGQQPDQAHPRTAVHVDPA
jgi:hypothetical protein